MVKIESIEMVQVQESHYEFIRTLRTHPENIKGFLTQTPISSEDQVKYMKRYSGCYRICLVNDEPAGYVGVIDKDIRICTHPLFKGIGVGYYMLSEIIKIFPEASGKILKENIASKNLFIKCKVPYELI